MSDNPVTLEFAKRLEREMSGQPEAILATAYLAERARAEEAEAKLANAEGREAEAKGRARGLEEVLAERDAAIAANHSAAVCAEHVPEFTGDDCLVCALAERDKRIAELEGLLHQALPTIKRATLEGADAHRQIRAALDAKEAPDA